MKLTTLFIYRPIATILLAIGLAFSGIIAFHFLPVSMLPKIEFPTISVDASLPGASPEVMATSVATPLERYLGKISGITEMTSTSGLGSTRITLQFDLSRDIDGAARDVQAAINAAQGQLPANLPHNPTYRKVNPAEAPVMILALTSPTYTTGRMYDAAFTILQQKLAQIKGIGQVIIGGSSLPAIRIELNPTILNHYHIDLDEVRNIVADANVNLPKGQLIENQKTSEIVTNDQIFTPEEYQKLIIAYRHGTAVRLADVAEVKESVEDLRNAGLLNGKPSVIVVLFKQPGANVIETVDGVRKTLPYLQASIPEEIDLTVMMDRTTTIRASLKEVEMTLILSMLLVIGVVYLFLGNKRAALISSIAVPLSLLGTFSIMYLLEYSLDNLSLMALTIVTSFLIDDAVVILENISRYIEEGMQPFRAALHATKEVSFTVLSMSLSLIAVFIPILFMGGIAGRLFREFAVTLSVAVSVSLVVALTVIPTLSARLLKVNFKSVKRPGKRYSFYRIKHYYATSLKWALAHPKFIVGSNLSILFLTFYLFGMVPKGFFPQQDTGRIVGSLQLEQDMSFQAMQRKLKEYIKIISEDPEVQDVVGFVGSSLSGSSSGSFYISLKSFDQRSSSATEIIQRLRAQFKEIPGAALYMQAAQDLVIGARLSSAQFQYTLSADNLADLKLWAPRVMEKIAKLPGIIDLNSDQRDKGLQAYINVDRNTAARFNITAQQIDNVLYDAFGQRQISTLYTDLNQYQVVMEVAPRYWQTPEMLSNVYLTALENKKVPLSAFASFSKNSALLAVNHQGQFPAITLSFNLLPGFSLGEVVKTINNTVNDMRLPASIRGSFQGTAQAFNASLADEPFLILLAILVVYVILGILYENVFHPITILSTLPSAGAGALFALLLSGTEFTIIALIGMILLIGIVKKNAIMMIDFAIQLKKNEKISAKDAIYNAALLRFRPITMTTFATLCSALPLIVGTGVGFELRRPLGITIVGGLLISQLLTLYTTPIVYVMLERVSRFVSKGGAFLVDFKKLLIPRIRINEKN